MGKAKQVEPLTLKAKAAVVKRRQNFVAPAQARRRWLVASIRVKAILRFNKPIPRVSWGGQRLTAVRGRGNRIKYVRQGSFERFLDLPTMESPPLASTPPREPLENALSRIDNLLTASHVLPPVASSNVVCGTTWNQTAKHK